MNILFRGSCADIGTTLIGRIMIKRKLITHKHKVLHFLENTRLDGAAYSVVGCLGEECPLFGSAEMPYECIRHFSIAEIQLVSYGPRTRHNMVHPYSCFSL